MSSITAKPVELPQPLQPLLGSVLAVLKAARECSHEINRTKLVKLLYFADLAAVESGGTAFTGATWRWDNFGPYDHALKRAENTVVEMEIVDRDDQTRVEEYGSCHLALAFDIDDPLPAESMRIIRRVVSLHGAKSASVLRKLSYQTPPMVEAEAAGDRNVLLDLSRARRVRQIRELLERHRRHRAVAPKQTDDAGIGDELLAEMRDLAELRGHVNVTELGDR
ncbi:type II toxin-antitoxin system antitoxin SocA domain-containing protein [Actinoallomurus bryophytorum]|uniref:type II toxin-antitoxin system antitoxin SocA domain-containing protein n=1 Tax=Actinoallomurus bryophytorum TaxID=1490222 RepID=UPI00163A2F7C|nr:type II toxin-antitoxin system antitoxin SocA domain-containing protein [Actinoallomurus bryophytorum]